MGWFSADEIVNASASANSEGHMTAQTIALCVLAGAAAAYLLSKIIAKVHKRNTERVAENAAKRIVACQV